MRLMLTFFLFFAAEVRGGQSKCEDLTWIEVPVIKAGKFQGTLKASCTISGLTLPDIGRLYDHFVGKAVAGATVVHAGPTEDRSLGLKGFSWDLTVSTKSGKLRNLLRMATDDLRILRYSIQSKEISFSGMAGYLRKLDIDYSVEILGPETARVTLENLTHVQKPAVAPGAVFLPIAIRNSEEEFQKNLQSLVKEVAENL